MTKGPGLTCPRPLALSAFSVTRRSLEDAGECGVLSVGGLCIRGWFIVGGRGM